MFSRAASGGRLAHTAEPSSSGSAVYCLNSDTYGENIGHTQVAEHKRVAKWAGQCHSEGAIYYIRKIMVISGLLEEKNPSYLLSGRERKRIWVVTGWSPSLQTVVRLWSKSWKLFPGTWRIRILFFYENMRNRNSHFRSALVNHVCPKYLVWWNEMFSHSITVVKLERYGLFKWIVKWVKCGCIIRLKRWWLFTWCWNRCWVWVVSNTVNLFICNLDDGICFTQQIHAWY